MRVVKLAHAGCDDEVINKLIMAAALFRGRDIDVTVQPWENDGEDLVVISSFHAYGRQIDDIARGRAIPRLTVYRRPPEGSVDGVWVLRDRPVFEYFRILEALLAAIPGQMLASYPSLRIETLNRASAGLWAYGRARVFLDPQAGVCRAASQWDMIVMAEALRCGWPVKQLPAEDRAVAREVVTSLEGFVFTTLVGRQACEWQGSLSLSLSAWPDIRSHRYGHELARLSATLIASAADLESLMDIAPARVVAAFLHACRVAGLLHENGPSAVTDTPQRASPGAKSRVGVALRHWLGLSGKPTGDGNKLVFVGPRGAGKTTAIRSISGSAPVITEELVPAGPAGKKGVATLSLEYHYLKLESQILHLYGLYGCEGLGDIRDLPVSEALGLVLLLDATESAIYDDAEAWLAHIRGRYPDLPVAVGVTKTDRSRHFSLNRLRGVVGAVPTLSVDARDSETLRQLLRMMIMQGV